MQNNFHVCPSDVDLRYDKKINIRPHKNHNKMNKKLGTEDTCAEPAGKLLGAVVAEAGLAGAGEGALRVEAEGMGVAVVVARVGALVEVVAVQHR